MVPENLIVTIASMKTLGLKLPGLPLTRSPQENQELGETSCIRTLVSSAGCPSPTRHCPS